jgi:hypothetical protein
MCAEMLVWFQVYAHVYGFTITFKLFDLISAGACIFSLQIVPAVVYQLTLFFVSMTTSFGLLT